MDYEKQVNDLKTFSGSFKPEAGKYQIVILAEPEETEYVDSEGKKTPQIKLGIEVNKEKKDWYMGVGKTFNSLYGQLMLIGKEKGTLTGEVITLLVKRSNNKNEYTILEAVDLINKQK